MLLSLVLKLTPKMDMALPLNLGRASHALFLSLVAAQDAGLAERLHQPGGPKPFTCSSLTGIGRPTSSTIELKKGQEHWLRLTSIDKGLSILLLESCLPNLPKEVELADGSFLVLGATTDPEEHPWAGKTSYEELVRKYLLDSRAPEDRIGFAFVSPTTFRSKGMNIPLPLPQLVFGSLLEKWNSFSPIALSPDLKRFASECWAISRYRIRTRTLHFQNVLHVGFVGHCQYVALNKDQYWLRASNLLAEFAFYAGVGYQTTVGMGQTRKIEGSIRREITPSALQEGSGRHFDFEGGGGRKKAEITG